MVVLHTLLITTVDEGKQHHPAASAGSEGHGMPCHPLACRFSDTLQSEGNGVMRAPWGFAQDALKHAHNTLDKNKMAHFLH